MERYVEKLVQCPSCDLIKKMIVSRDMKTKLDNCKNCGIVNWRIVS